MKMRCVLEHSPRSLLDHLSVRLSILRYPFRYLSLMLLLSPVISAHFVLCLAAKIPSCLCFRRAKYFDTLRTFMEQKQVHVICLPLEMKVYMILVLPSKRYAL